MGMPAYASPHWTAADVRDLMVESRPWPRYELLDGELLVTPAPAAAHQVAVGELFLVIATYCRRMRIGLAVLSPADLELLPDTIMQPDVFVVPPGTFPKDVTPAWSYIKALVLAVEVLSPSTVRTDRVSKRDFYLANGVREYWIVDLDARVVESWTPERSRPVLCRDELVWQPEGASEPLSVSLPHFFEERCGLPRLL